VRRVFWIAVGLGAGATVGIIASRWARRQTQKVAPANLGRQAKSGLSDLGSLFRESMDAYRRASAQREAEMRSAIALED